MSWLLRVLLSFTGLLVYPFTSLVDKSKRCVSQLCAKGARTRYNDWGDGARGVEVAGEWVKMRAAVRGRADDELCPCSERGGEQRENAPVVGKSARARFIIDRRGAGVASCRRETAVR